MFCPFLLMFLNLLNKFLYFVYNHILEVIFFRSNQYESQILETNNSSSIESSNFDPNSETIIFFHGFLETSKSNDGLLMKECE